MGLLTNILGSMGGTLVKDIGEVADKFITTGAEREQFKIESAKIVQAAQAQTEETLRAEIGAQSAVMVAEMTQGDSYTKRARPTLVYAGLAIIFIDYIVFPAFLLPPTELPAEFWLAWGGTVGVWSIGRSAEKRAASNSTAPSSITNAITGSGPIHAVTNKLGL